MKNLAATTEAAAVWIGLGRVVGHHESGRPRVQLLSAMATTVVAEWALPYRYDAATGDLLQLLGQQLPGQRGRYWVTGVALGRGRSQLAFHGHEALRASGALRLRADAAVRLRAPELTIRTNLLEQSVTTVVQKAGETHTTSNVLTERAGQCSRMIEGEDRQVAGRHETIARHVVKIDGDLLQLG